MLGYLVWFFFVLLKTKIFKMKYLQKINVSGIKSANNVFFLFLEHI